MMLASIDDMESAFGADEVEALSTRQRYGKNNGEDPHTVLVNALMRASSEAASYLAASYPVFDAIELPKGFCVPPVLISVVCDITRYRMVGAGVTETDPISTRYEQALNWLRAVATGTALLAGCSPLSGEGSTTESTRSSLNITPGVRAWARQYPPEVDGLHV